MSKFSFKQSGGDKSYGQKGNYKEAKPVKNNGCKSGNLKQGGQWINGWNNSKDRGFVKVSIFPYHKSKVVTSSSDNKGGAKQHVSMMAEIQYVNSGMTDHYPVLYCITTGTVLLEKHGWLLNTKKGNMTRYTGPQH